jgi:hypothetical protein
MMRAEISVDGKDGRELASAIRAIVGGSPDDAVLSIRVSGVLTDEHWRAMSAARLRRYVPETMNVDVRPDRGFLFSQRSDDDVPDEQLTLLG